MTETVANRVEIKRWDEYDEQALPDPRNLFWRQHLNYVTKQLSVRRRIVTLFALVESLTDPKQPLRDSCVCKRPVNPDERLLRCENDNCKKWLHKKCLRGAGKDSSGENGMENGSTECPSCQSKLRSIERAVKVEEEEQGEKEDIEVIH
jgi:hypothetical protein